ncbi:MAG: membrane protein insertase YidC [Actinobacteria bacterium]|nr:membrane protein insertase YidC [Actinomycetota bacterium]
MNDILTPDLLLALNPISDFFGPLIDLLRGFLRILDDWTGSWGIAIILLTICVRIVIFPLTWKQIKSQRAMQALQPKIKELQRKHKGDKKKLQQETMRLYQEYRVNPFASCLPLLLQLPIFICLYYAIRGTPELQNATFLWFTLGEPDPYYILLVVYVASQLASTELMLTPETQSQQKWIMRAMPFMFVIFLRNFPSGLFLYWITTNMWTVGQQLVIKYLAKKRPVQLEKVDPSKQKRSRFMEAMSAAQEQRETQPAAGRTGKKGAPAKRGAPGKKGVPAGKGAPAKKGTRPAGEAGTRTTASAGKPGARPAKGGSGTAGQVRGTGKPSRRPEPAPATPDAPPASGAGDGGRPPDAKRKRRPADKVQTTRTGKRPVKPKTGQPRPESESR